MKMVVPTRCRSFDKKLHPARSGCCLEKNTGLLSRERNCTAVIEAVGVLEAGMEGLEETQGAATHQ